MHSEPQDKFIDLDFSLIIFLSKLTSIHGEFLTLLKG